MSSADLQPSSADRELLIIGGASPRPGADCLDQAAARGLRVCVLDTAGNLAAAPELAARAHRTVALDYTDATVCRDWALAQPAFLGVYGFRETAMLTVAVVSEALGLAGNPPEAVRLIQHKQRCRAALRQVAFRQPAGIGCPDESAALRFLDRHPDGPWIVKPVTGRGSAGVSLLTDRRELSAAVQHVSAGRDRLADELREQGIEPAGDIPLSIEEFLIEEFQAGPEYSAEGLFVDGVPRVLAITEKATTGAPHFVEFGHLLPAPLPPDLRRAAEGQVCAALVALGLRWGVYHVEFWVAPMPDGTGSPIVLGELHIRPGGDYIHVMTQYVTGVELHGSVFDQFLRQPPRPPAPRLAAAAVRFLMPAAGELASVSNWDQVVADSRFVEGRLTLSAGSTVAAADSSMDRASYLIATGTDPAAARAAAEDLLQRISLTYAARQELDSG